MPKNDTTPRSVVIEAGMPTHIVEAKLRAIGYVISEEGVIVGYRNSTGVGHIVGIGTETDGKEGVVYLHVSAIDADNKAMFARKAVKPKDDPKVQNFWHRIAFGCGLPARDAVPA